jgi:hypothetical protein
MPGGVSATPEEYKNEILRRHLDSVNIHPGPMIMKAVDDGDLDIGSLNPWKVWKVTPPPPKITIRDYVDAHTRAESWGRIDLERPLAGAYWPEVKRYRSWVSTITFYSMMALAGWILISL